MKKRWMYFICFICLIFLLAGCHQNNAGDDIGHLNDSINNIDNTNNIAEESDSDSPSDTDNSEQVYCYNYGRYVDIDDEDSLKKSIRTSINDASEEQEFLADYIHEDTEYELTDEAGSRLYIINDEYEISFIFMVKSVEEEDYPKKAFAFKSDKDEMISEAVTDGDIVGVNVLDTLLDLNGEAYQDREYMKPLQDYYTVEYTRDSDNKIVSASYSSDTSEYGTFLLLW